MSDILHTPKAPRAVTDGDIILATVDVELSPDQVFRAMNTRDLEVWWGEEGVYSMTKWFSDLQIGGLWHVETLLADGKKHPAGGEFLEIEAPHKIVFTRKYEWDFPLLGQRVTKVTYLADPIPSGTRVTVKHEQPEGLREPAEIHADGWERVLGWLTKYK
jgi:uncharacterized protein YndB with AHSA1/START domain